MNTIINATKDQVKEFIDSVLWKDMKRELLMWRRKLESDCLNVVTRAANAEENTASVLTQLGSIQGRAMMIDYVLEMPKVFLSLLEADSEE